MTRSAAGRANGWVSLGAIANAPYQFAVTSGLRTAARIDYPSAQ